MFSNRFTKITVISLVVISMLPLLGQNSGLMKSVVDAKTGLTFNNFRTDSTESVFYEVKLDNSLVYSEPKRNADLIYSLDVSSIVEYIEMGHKKKFVKIRIVDTLTNTIEGWIRKTNLSKTKLYGRSFLSFTKDRTDEKVIGNDLSDPRWLKKSNQKLYVDESLSGSIVASLNIGDLVYVDSLMGDTVRAKFRNSEGTYVPGYIKAEALSPLALIDNAQTDFDELFKKTDQLVFMYGLDKSGFLSYSGILVTNDVKKMINEDKVCRNVGKDSLMYKYTFTENIKDVVKKWELKSSPSRHDFTMYRQLDDEDVVTRADTLNCHVYEIVHRPKTASIILNDVEEAKITNRTSKLYIHHLENFDMDIVFQKETDEHIWSYKKNVKTGEYLESNYKPTRIFQRVIAFRKYDIEK